MKTDADELIIVNKDAIKTFRVMAMKHGHTLTSTKGVVEGFEHLGQVNIAWNNKELGLSVMIHYKSNQEDKQ